MLTNPVFDWMTALARTLPIVFSRLSLRPAASGWETHDPTLKQRHVISIFKTALVDLRVLTHRAGRQSSEKGATREKTTPSSLFEGSELAAHFLSTLLVRTQLRSAAMPAHSDEARGLRGWPGERTEELKAG